MKQSEEKKFNLTVARGYEIKNGYWSVPIDEEIYSALQQVEMGGRLICNIVREESRKHDKSPHCYFQFMSAEDEKKFQSRVKTNAKSEQQPPRAYMPKNMPKSRIPAPISVGDDFDI